MVVMGHQIGKELIEALGLPKHTIGFTLRCYTQEVVTVECEYYPEGQFLAPALARYELLRRPDEVAQAEQPAANFDTWMRERTETAHATYMARHSKGGQSYPQRASKADVCRYFGVPLPADAND